MLPRLRPEPGSQPGHHTRSLATFRQAASIAALISRSKALVCLLHSLSMATHQERNPWSDTGRNPSSDRHRFSQEQWNSLIYCNETGPHHNGDPISHEPCISIFNRIFNSTQMPHYGFLSHQVYSFEYETYFHDDETISPQMASGIPVDGISPVVQRPQFIDPGFQFVASIDRLLDALAGRHSSGRANPNHRAPIWTVSPPCGA